MSHPLHANIDFSHFSDEDLDTKGGEIKNQLTTNAGDFPALPISMLIYGGHLTTYHNVLTSAIYPNQSGDLLTARTNLESDLRKNGVYINTISAGVLSMLQKSGYPISKEHAPVGPLGKAGFKSIVSIPNGFEIELEKVPHADAYLVCVKPTAQVTTNDYKKWQWYNTSSTKLRIDDLDSAVKYTLVAVAIGSNPTLTFSSEEKGVTQ